ncbi:MAG: serine/threonine protein kinase [Myxococcaceae bacterium]|nr:serine/threonine protein kinase [Myxococcaceae bacterium]
MAEVYRARVRSGPRAGQEVALKRLLPEFAGDPAYVDQFTSEADLSRRLDHPHVVRVLEVGVHEEIYFMVMELVDGRDLGQVIRRCRERGIHLPLDFAVFLVKALLDALAHAHEVTAPDGRPLEVVHCDVSPSNLFVSRTGEVKLGDFGVARARIGGGDTGQLQGKPYYLSPEALDGEITPEVDLWAATVTLYELLTLRRPFTGATADEVFAQVRERRFAPPSQLRPDVSPALDEIIDRAFSRRRADRFLSAREYAARLEPLFDERIGNPMAIAAVVRGLFDAPSGAHPAERR